VLIPADERAADAIHTTPGGADAEEPAVAVPTLEKSLA
jgi:hypothetical protein